MPVVYYDKSLSSFLAVAAKAPRKNLPSSRSAVSPSGGGNKKKAKGVGGNPFKMWPTPKWQQNLHTFLGVEQPESSCSSEAEESSSSANTSVDMMTEAQGTSAGSSSSCQDGLQGSSSKMSAGLELLSGDIAQLNSDSEDDD